MLIRIIVESGTGFRQVLEDGVEGAARRRVALSVPYAEKDQAKELGARWDADARVWYVPENLDASMFWRWLDRNDETRVRCDSYALAQTPVKCWRCTKVTDVFALFVPSGFQYRAPADKGHVWRTSSVPTMLSYVTNLLPDVARHVQHLTSRFRVDASKSRGGLSYWMNHCAACGAKVGDFGLHRDPGGPFFAAHAPGASRVDVLHSHNATFVCSGDVSFSGDDLFYVSLEERHYG